jgi:hypothetical protein
LQTLLAHASMVAMRPILFSVGSLNFYSYGFFTAVGFIAAGTIVDYLARRKRLLTKKHREYFFLDGILLTLVIALIAARVGYIVLYSLILKTETLALANHLLGGGFIFYAGLLAGLAAFYWWIKRHNEPAMPWFDILSIAVLVGFGFNEIGGYGNDNSVVHLVGLIGSFALAALTYAVYITERKAGLSFRIGFLSLFVLNFFLGFWRNEEILIVGLSLTQWASLIGVIGVSFVKNKTE